MTSGSLYFLNNLRTKKLFYIFSNQKYPFKSSFLSHELVHFQISSPILLILYKYSPPPPHARLINNDQLKLYIFIHSGTILIYFIVSCYTACSLLKVTY